MGILGIEIQWFNCIRRGGVWQEQGGQDRLALHWLDGIGTAGEL